MSQVNNAPALYNQQSDFDCIQILLPFLKHKSFIDIGAEKGSFTTFLSDQGLVGSFFEPLPKFQQELTEIAKKTGSTFYTYAVDEVDRQADFYTASDDANNPMDYFSSLHPLSEDKRITHKKVTTVTCRSLNSLLQDALLPQEIGVLKIDTEGNDLNVLKGMGALRTEVLMCEFFMPGIYAGWELGHPAGLICEAQKLGFTHFIAIKRLDEYEQVTLDNPVFIDKQWGNLVFLHDDIYEAAKENLTRFLLDKEKAFLMGIAKNTELLRKTCDERLALIEALDVSLQKFKANSALGVSHKIACVIKKKLRGFL